eukprot:m.458870 g.458870  ORF g.458870 m.458870 type:complete len:55 (-) comp20337_c2_seq43:2105-2269(-)
MPLATAQSVVGGAASACVLVPNKQNAQATELGNVEMYSERCPVVLSTHFGSGEY